MYKSNMPVSLFVLHKSGPAVFQVFQKVFQDLAPAVVTSRKSRERRDSMQLHKRPRACNLQ